MSDGEFGEFGGGCNGKAEKGGLEREPVAPVNRDLILHFLAVGFRASDSRLSRELKTFRVGPRQMRQSAGTGRAWEAAMSVLASRAAGTIAVCKRSGLLGESVH